MSKIFRTRIIEIGDDRSFAEMARNHDDVLLDEIK
jgi:hypothetical protein